MSFLDHFTDNELHYSEIAGVQHSLPSNAFGSLLVGSPELCSCWWAVSVSSSATTSHFGMFEFMFAASRNAAVVSFMRFHLKCVCIVMACLNFQTSERWGDDAGSRCDYMFAGKSPQISWHLYDSFRVSLAGLCHRNVGDLCLLMSVAVSYRLSGSSSLFYSGG